MQNVSEIKFKHILIGSIGAVILLSFSVKAYKKVRKSVKSKKAYTDPDGNIALRIHNALYPDGKKDENKLWWMPGQALIGIFNIVDKLTSKPPDTDILLRIASNDLTEKNFKEVAKFYKAIYDSNMITDIEDRLKGKFSDFEERIRTSTELQNNPEKKNKILKILANKIFDDLDSWGRADDELYEQLNQLPDVDFETVYYLYADILKKELKEGTLNTYIADTYTIDNSKAILLRFNKMGLE
jgi:hypothetical protein